MRENPLKQCVELAEEARVILEVITASSAAAAALKHWRKPAATADLNKQRFSYDGVRVCKASSTATNHPSASGAHVTSSCGCSFLLRMSTLTGASCLQQVCVLTF